MAKPTEITFGLFTEWNKNCRVRQVQKQFERIAMDAKNKSTSIDEEMKDQGFKDYAAFAKTCPQFNLTCWPEEFAELGSGFVLYFQFLGFLMSVLFLMFLLQIPAMMAYAGEDWLVGWHWTKWQDAWSDNQDACKCIGTNGGHLGPGYDPMWGTSCKVWDYEWCIDSKVNTSASVQELGKWCCSTWCFAKEQCHTPEEGEKALWNRHLDFGLVRATSACTQDQTYVDKCHLYADKVFNEPGTQTGPVGRFIGKIFLTPGNFGPDQADNQLVPLLFLVAICAIAFMTLFLYQHQIYTDSKVDAGTTAPNDFAILVKGLPVTAYDEKALREWFQDNILKGRSTEIVKVVIGWDYGEFRERIKELRSLNEALKELEPESDAYKQTKSMILKIKTDLVRVASDNAARLRSSGVVVVVLRHQADLRACLRRWGSFWARWFYCDAEDFCCLKGFLKGTPLPRFPVGDPPRPTNQITVGRAANPGDIHWEELGKSSSETYTLFMKTNGFMFILIVICFGVTYGLNMAQAAISEKQNNKNTAGLQALSILPAIGVAMINCVLMVSARRLGDKEYHETWTSQEFSQAAKMAVALFINTAAVLLFSNIQPKEWYQVGGLIDDALMILIMDALLPPIFFFFDLKYRIKMCGAGRKLTQARIDSWNQTIRENSGDPSPQKEQARNIVKAEVESFKRVMEPSEMDYPRRYANALNTFFCTLLFSPVFPFALLIGMTGLFLQYWIDKYMLVRWYKRPKRPYNANLAHFSLRMVKFVAPLGLAIAFWFFLTPSWKDKGQVTFPFFVSLLVAAAMIFLPSSILRTALGLRCLMAAQGFRVVEDDGSGDYYDAQYMWSKEMKYHKDHFLYKSLPEARNPEFLKPGEDTATKLEDIKGSYGTATTQAADKAGGSGESDMALKGGGKVGGDLDLEEGGGAAVGAAGAAGDVAAPLTYGVKPTTFEAGAAADPTPAAVAPVAAAEAPVPATAEPAAEPAVPPAPTPASAAASAPTPHVPAALSKPTWEYENNKGGWDDFNADCQDYLEKKYQDFLRSGGKGKGKGSQINVRTTGKEISIDFSKMTSKVKDSHKIRSIHRKEA